MDPHRRVVRFVGSAAVFWLALGTALPAEQDDVRHILLLQSFDRGNLALDHFTANLRVDLDEREGRRVNIIQVPVGPIGFVAASDEAVVNYILATFANRKKPDLILTVGGPAATFARRYRARIFPDSPLCFAAVDQRFIDQAPLARNETAVAVRNDGVAIVEEILRLLPGTRRMFMMVGAGPLGQFWKAELTRDLERFRDRLTFEWTDNLSLPEILRRAKDLPPQTAIFYVLFGTDASGAAYADERVMHALRETANAPIFGVHNVYVGLGAVGGTVMSIDDLSHTASDVVIRLLNGASPADVRIPTRAPGPPVFDARELERWRIDEGRLPPGSIVHFRTPSLWSRYSLAIFFTMAALIAQSLLIVGLLYQRRARQRAEFESRRNLALAADAGRRQTMTALTNSLTHELGQPLSSMIHNAQALQRIAGANRATPAMIDEILSDIQTQGTQAVQVIDRHRSMLQSRELEKRPIDANAVIRESLTLVAHDLRSRGIDAVIDLDREACTISGDPVLLRQVLVNLVINAADAMSDTPPGKRRVTVTSEAGPHDVRVAVRDAGAGLPAELNGHLFAPFATTKANGLGIGLTIAKSIVEAHDGSIEAGNNPAGGATFRITLPRDVTTVEHRP